MDGLTTLHRWFQSGRYSLLGHADLPVHRGSMGLVIVPPFGWEDVSAYRPLRFVARKLAANGIAVLRFDLPATGDSSGDLSDPELFDCWIQSVGDAAAELRALTGVGRIAIFGVRVGATLAVAAASREANVQDLILWGAPACGRAEFREMRAYASMERWEFDPDPPPGSQTADGFEVGGFLIPPEMQRDWEGIDLTALPMNPRRVLLLSRDDISCDAKLVRSFESAGCAVQTETGSGYSAMMRQPHEAAFPGAVADAILRFLAPSSCEKVRRLEIARASAAIEHAGARVTESVHTVPMAEGPAFGIFTEPPPRLASSDWCVLFLNAGGVRHVGPNRMWVEAARRHALRGIASLRLDLLGIGESDGPPALDIPDLYQEELVEQVERAIESLRSRGKFRRFAAVGLCSGAFWAFHAAFRNPEIRLAVLLNPRLFFWDPEADFRRAVRRGTKGLTNPADWWRVVRGGVQMDDLKRAARVALGTPQANFRDAFSHPQIPAERLAETWQTIERNGSRMTLVFTEREPLLFEMEDEGRLPDESYSRIQLVRLGKAGHTFRPRWAQQIVYELIDREIQSAVNEERVPAV